MNPIDHAPISTDARRYDGVTIAFHWITAALVLTLFGTAMAWTYLPRDLGLRWLQGVHISLGVALAVTLVARLVWRTTGGRRLPEVGTRMTRTLSRAVHWALYGLLILQVGLGFGIEWFAGNAISFFSLFSIDSPFAGSRDIARQAENIHLVVAWAMMILVGGHSAAALFHRYVHSDGVLQRMLPIAR